jgi:hypothetical protein
MSSEVCRSFKQFLEFTGILYRNCYVREISVSSWFVAFGMQPVGNTPKNGEPIFGFSFTTMLQHTSQFWSRIS